MGAKKVSPKKANGGRGKRYCVSYSLDCGGTESVEAQDEEEATEIVMQMYKNGTLTAIEHDDFRVYEVDEEEDDDSCDDDDGDNFG